MARGCERARLTSLITDNDGKWGSQEGGQICNYIVMTLVDYLTNGRLGVTSMVILYLTHR